MHEVEAQESLFMIMYITSLMFSSNELPKSPIGLNKEGLHMLSILKNQAKIDGFCWLNSSA